MISFLKRCRDILMYLYISILKIIKKGLIINGKVIIKGKILIKNYGNGKIVLSNNVTLNSNNKKYFINMHSPMKLFTNKNGIIKIGENSRLHGTCIHAYERIEIGKNCLIAANCQIFDTNRHELLFDAPEQRLQVSDKTKPILIKDNVWLGANVIVLPGVIIGEGSVIAAGSVVNKDVEPFTLNGGNPIKEIYKYKN